MAKSKSRGARTGTRRRSTGAGGGRKPGMYGYSKPARIRDSHGRSRMGNNPIGGWYKAAR